MTRKRSTPNRQAEEYSRTPQRLPPARVPSDQSARAAAAAAVAGAQHGDDDSDRAAAALFALSASPAVGAAPPMARHSDSFSVGVRGAVNTSAHRGGSYLELPTSLGNTPNLQAAEVLEARPLGASPMPRTDSATFFQDAAAHGTPHRWQAPMSALRHRVGVPSQAMTTGTSQPPSISGSGLTPFLQEDAFRSGMSSVLLGPGRNGQADVGITPELHGGTAAMLDALVGGSVQERSTGTPAGANMLGLFGTPNLIPNHGLEHTMQWLPPESRQRRAAAAVEDERPLKATPRLHEHLCRDFAVSEELSHADAAGSGESPGGASPRVEKRRRRALDKPPSPPLPPSPPPDADMQADPAALESSAAYQEALEFLQRLRGEQYERPPWLPPPLLQSMQPVVEERTEADGTPTRYCFVPVFVPHPYFFVKWMQELAGMNVASPSPRAPWGATTPSGHGAPGAERARANVDQASRHSDRVSWDAAHGGTASAPVQEPAEYVPSPTVYCHFAVPPIHSATSAEERRRLENLISEHKFKQMTRQAAIVRFRQKKKERKFEKRVRYSCRKNLADVRPRVKGRFVKMDTSSWGSEGAAQSHSTSCDNITASR
ncbi:hypothetical protein CDCA_CDCA12G3402 [Cyanidium caldarium]|uniref:CCT domain-containing protein n=1 Tax=Cyanidium caldarium TaxID=2771 RepID=A0AAV9IYH9_CYACA|nr:hypothetical protein CDCA_CDCA12G3402 [Cyanidium caldarium]